MVDSNNNPIPNQQLIAGSGGYTQGSTFSVLLPAPSGNNLSQTIKVQTQQVNNGQTTVVSTATNSNTLTTKDNIGIAEMLPSAVYLTSANPEQYVTFSNIGDAMAQLQELASNNPNVEVVFNPTNLNSGSTTTATLRLKNTSVAATTGNITLTYNNGQNDTTSSGTVDQNVNPTPSPSPTPTPTPTPGPGPAPSPVPVADLTVVFSPDNDFFTTTASGAASRQMTITNTGNTTEDNITLVLPANFTISSGTSNGCTVTQGMNPGAISDSLAAQTGCNITVTYSNNNLTAENTEDITISYDYNNGTPAPTPTEAAVDYRVTQSTAILSLTVPWNPYNFINISGVSGTDSATQTFTLYNSGEVAATNVVGSISPTSIFSILTNYGLTIAAGTSGNLDLQFGPSSSFGSYNTTLTVNYDDYPTHVAIPVTVGITGSVSNAIAYLKTVGATGFAGGDGQTAATAYALQTGSNGQITLTYENKGNEDAQNFRLTLGTISSKLTGTPFTLLLDGCNLDAGGKTLTPNETCDEVLQYSPTTAGSTTLPLDTSSWEYSYSDTHGSYTYNSAPIYFNAYAPATIAITTSGLINGEVPVGGSFQISAALSGGYQVPNQTIALQNLNPADANINTSNTCQVSSTASQCSINVPVGSSATIGSYTLDVINQTGGATITSGSPVTFSATPVNYGSFLVCNDQSPFSCYTIINNNWQLISGSVSGYIDWGGLATSPAGTYSYACNQDYPYMCYYGENGGSWQIVPQGVSSSSMKDGNITVFDDGSAVSCNDTQCFSSYRGSAWVAIPQGNLTGTIQYGGLLVLNNTNKTLAACTEYAGCYYSINGAAWVKINGSIGYIAQSNNVSNGGQNILTVCNNSTNPSTCYRSVNLGAFSAIPSGEWISGGVTTSGMVSSNTSDSVVACTSENPYKCYKSVNGNAWTLINGTVSGYLMRGAIVASGDLLVSCNGNFPFVCYKSINSDWQQIGGTISGYMITQGLVANNAGIILACNSSSPFTCYISINGSDFNSVSGSTSGSVYNANVSSDLMNFKGHG